jgi:hypothetical protein
LEITLGTLWIEGCVDPRTGVDDMEEEKNLAFDRIQISAIQSIARQYTNCYPGSPNITDHY